MQYILTQSEYDELVNKQPDSIKLLREENIQLRTELKELKAKYDKLLVFGVTTSHHKR